MDVREEETLARYLYGKSHFKTSTNTVKHHAFMPPADKKLPVFRTDGLIEEQIWALGDTLRAEAMVARADISVLNVKATGLVVDPDEPPARHACIVGLAPRPVSHSSKGRSIVPESCSQNALTITPDPLGLSI